MFLKALLWALLPLAVLCQLVMVSFTWWRATQQKRSRRRKVSMKRLFAMLMGPVAYVFISIYLSFHSRPSEVCVPSAAVPVVSRC